MFAGSGMRQGLERALSSIESLAAATKSETEWLPRETELFGEYVELANSLGSYELSFGKGMEYPDWE